MALVLISCSTATSQTDGAAPSFDGCDFRGGSVALAIGGRAGSPAPDLPAKVGRAIAAAVDATPARTPGPKVTVVSVDGRPEVVDTATFVSDAQNDNKLLSDRTAFVNGLGSAVKAVRAKTTEADDLDAIALAVRATGDGPGTIVLVDSGLQTVAPLDFRRTGLLDATPADIVSALGASEIPNLRGKTVLLSGIGDTASPQSPLSTAQRAQLSAIYTAILRAGHADCVATLPEPRSGAAPAEVPPVSLVPITQREPIDPGAMNSTVLADGNTVGFEPDTAILRDPAGAASTLQPLGRWLAANPARAIKLTGTTARFGDRDSQIQLATDRANAIGRVLQSQGAQAGQIVTVGLGSYFDGYVPDHRPDGSPIPEAAARNRTVVIEITHR